MTAYPIQDVEGLRLVWQPELHKGDCEFDDVVCDDDCPALNPIECGSEVRALCIDCAGEYKYLTADSPPNVFEYCPHCQDGQVLYRITGEVELKRANEILEPMRSDEWQGLLDGIEKALESKPLSEWLCVAPAER